MAKHDEKQPGKLGRTVIATAKYGRFLKTVYKKEASTNGIVNQEAGVI